MSDTFPSSGIPGIDYTQLKTKVFLEEKLDRRVSRELKCLLETHVINFIHREMKEGKIG